MIPHSVKGVFGNVSNISTSAIEHPACCRLRVFRLQSWSAIIHSQFSVIAVLCQRIDSDLSDKPAEKSHGRAQHPWLVG